MLYADDVSLNGTTLSRPKGLNADGSIVTADLLLNYSTGPQLLKDGDVLRLSPTISVEIRLHYRDRSPPLTSLQLAESQVTSSSYTIACL